MLFQAASRMTWNFVPIFKLRCSNGPVTLRQSRACFGHQGLSNWLVFLEFVFVDIDVTWSNFNKSVWRDALTDHQLYIN